MTKLLGLDYEIQYKKGVENKVVDAFSRRGKSSQVLATTVIKPNWVLKVIENYEGDPLFVKVISAKIVDRSAYP